MATSAWGIDIGNRGLKALKLQRSADGIKVADFAFIEHDTILSEAGDNRETLIETALAKFVGRHDIRRTPVAMAVSGQQSFARFVKLPPVEAKKIPEIVKFEAVQQIPFPLDEVEWSYQLFQTDDDPDIEVGIFAIRKELVNEQVGRYQSVDLDITTVQTSPLAVYNAMRHDGRLDKGYAVIVDLGADSTDLVIADADSIWMRSLDIGGNNFTEALAKAFKIDFEKAEEMKRNAKTSKYAKQIYQAMRPVFGELVGEIQRSLGFFGSTHREAKLRKVIAVGGGFRLNGLSGYVQKNLQMPVEKPTKFTALPPDEAGATSSLSEHVLSSVAAYGLALQVMDEAKVTSSLLPTAIRKDKMWKDKTKYFVAASGLAVAGAIVAFAGSLFHGMAYDRAATERAAVDTLIGEAQNLDQQWTAVTGDGSAELQTVRNVNLLVQDRRLWGDILSDIYAAMPAPQGQLADALAGRLGKPGEVDEADVEAIKAVPRDQRQYVQVEKVESVYCDNLYEVLNAANFPSIAEDILRQRSPTGFRGVIASKQEINANEINEGQSQVDKEARGFIVRLTLTTPVSYEKAVGLFTTRGPLDPASRLIEIGPDAQNDKKPFSVPVAEPRTPRPFSEIADRIRDMEESYEARQILSGEVASPNAKPGNAAGAGGAGAAGGFGGGAAAGGRNSPYGGGYSAYPGGGGYGGNAGRPARPRPGGAGGAGGAAANNPDGDGPNPAYLDPVTQESRLRDTEFTVVFAVLLNPPPYKPADHAPEGEQEAQLAAGQ